MATYDYLCKQCGVIEEQVHGMNEAPEIKCGCGGAMEKMISHNYGGFILKGGTPSIHYREKQQRTKRSEDMKVRQRARYGDKPGPQITPNICGHETGTWANAHEVAKEISVQTGIDTSGYKKLAEKESPKKIIVAQS